ncbi:hypothetical protein [Mycoplasma struthionis]|uniref:Transglutaminase-like domain-containing protein n=1 Tax=Mycoplasma struthionis TaxID=538220 RepID=A0A502MIS1_9MOLU|nr:hypothetical protein [Mycoplasma struthionis]TPI01914.1 hypothetical protein FJM01_01465 [Mycoplasma struthionis]
MKMKKATLILISSLIATSAISLSCENTISKLNNKSKPVFVTIEEDERTNSKNSEDLNKKETKENDRILPPSEKEKNLLEDKTKISKKPKETINTPQEKKPISEPEKIESQPKTPSLNNLNNKTNKENVVASNEENQPEVSTKNNEIEGENASPVNKPTVSDASNENEVSASKPTTEPKTPARETTVETLPSLNENNNTSPAETTTTIENPAPQNEPESDNHNINEPFVAITGEPLRKLGLMRNGLMIYATSLRTLPLELQNEWSQKMNNIEELMNASATEANLQKINDLETSFNEFVLKLRQAIENANSSISNDKLLSKVEIRNLWIKAIKTLEHQKGGSSVTVTYPKDKVVLVSTAFDALQDFLQFDLVNLPYLSVASQGPWTFRVAKQGQISETIFQRNDLNTEGLKIREFQKNYVLSLFYEGMSIAEKAYVIMKYVTENLNYSDKNGNFLQTAYENNWGVCKEYVDLMTYLLSAANIRYKIGTGETHIFLVYQLDDNKWAYADPTFVDTDGSTTGEKAKVEIIGQTSTSSIDSSSAFQTFKLNQSVKLDKNPVETRSSWSYFPYDLDIKDGELIDQNYFDSHFMKTIYEYTWIYRDNRISAFQFYKGKFYFILKENNTFKLKVLDAKTNKIIDLNLHLKIAKPLLNEYNGKLYFLETDRKIKTLDLKNGNAVADFYNSTEAINDLHLQRFSEQTKLVVNKNILVNIQK